MVDFHTPADEAQDAWDFINGSSMRSLSFSIEDPIGSGEYRALPLGTQYTGTMVAEPEKRQATDFTTREAKFYADGKPIYDLVFTLQTAYADPSDEEDDGKRRLYMSGNMRKALLSEMREKKIKQFGIGTHLTVEFTAFVPNAKGGRPGKAYNVTIDSVQERVSPAVNAVMAEAGYKAVEEFPATAPAAPAPAGDADQMAAALALLDAPKPGIVISEESKQKVQTLIMANIDRARAIAAVAMRERPGDAAYEKALDDEIPF